MRKIVLAAIVLCAGAACNRSQPPVPPPAHPGPSILLVTLDTTRADAIGPGAAGVETPAFNAVAARGKRFTRAYATVPETLPSHVSIMTGLYASSHGVHQNGRYLPAKTAVAAEQLRQAGYRTSAFVSSFVLARRFGLARGFDVYDDSVGAANERTSRETTDAALAELRHVSDQPRFMWVHYYDPHFPYDPPEPYRTRYAKDPYRGEIAAMDEQLGRLVQAFERQAKGRAAIAIVADHGEGLGDHGESRHGDLIYQSTMHVPMVFAGPGVPVDVDVTAISAARVASMLQDWAAGREWKPADDHQEIVLGEAMKPYLEYGWQPQVMAAVNEGKEILAGTIESYDLSKDPGETRKLARPSVLRNWLERYHVPSLDVARGPEALDEAAKQRLASLGYVGSSATPIVRKDAPRPADMMPLLAKLEKASALFGDRRYAESIPLLENVLAEDRYNLSAALRLATAHSSLGHEQKAEELFRAAAAMAPKSQDVRTYLALHYARTKDWQRAVPLLEQVVAESPGRLTAVEALASLRARQAQQAMEAGDTAAAIAGFEGARALLPDGFTNDLELGVLYLAARRYLDARTALDRVPASHPGYPMALFKRAQVSVLLSEPDRLERIETARRMADATTRPLIERERLFK